jgi:hypothetical protein
VACGRKRSDGFGHRRHKTFFSPAHEPDEAGLGVTEESAHDRLGAAAREPVRVFQPTMFSHEEIMPSFSPPGNSENPKKKGIRRLQPHFFTHSVWRRAIFDSKD